MIIRKDAIVQITHSRKGTFVAVVLRDFDTEDENSWPLAIAKGYVRGTNTLWTIGDAIPCRGQLVSS